MLTKEREDAFVKLHAFEYPVHKRAAVINAIYHAIGIRIRKFPVVRKTYPKLSPNEQPQGLPTEDQHACQNHD